MAKYADVIVDISIDKLDKTFQYKIPEHLQENIEPGCRVDIPFGNRTLTGFVVEVTEQAKISENRIKELLGVCSESQAVESGLISLAAWMRSNYGGTMNQALKTVLPVKSKKKNLEKKMIRLAIDEEEAKRQLILLESKHCTARARLLKELIQQQVLEYTLVTQKLNVSAAGIRGLQEKGILEVSSQNVYRNPVRGMNRKGYDLTLNEEQQKVVSEVVSDMDAGIAQTYLLLGVTGSGKTEVYMELIAHTIEMGKQAIMLIPEIALTYQTVMRFYNRFGDRISILNSKLSQGERSDQIERARKGEVDIMIGPRSALFTPFERLGMIIIDEEHEPSYKSGTVPRYHARETAIELAKRSNASVVLGSATPSIESRYWVEQGKYKKLEMKERVSKKPLPSCEIIDLREELRRGNRSVLSLRLQELMEERLNNHQQIMLFLNRRGYSGFISCRMCGEVIKCPHCDVSLSFHNNSQMVCHYCGYQQPKPEACPSCGSKYIAGFKAGTQKIEAMVQERFPNARTIRMDFDTTRTKDAYEKILQCFANQEADILIGTQMIVKGHDFPNVTLVGILAADMSLHVNDFHAAERTFELLTRAAGRAGRGQLPGQVVIQTYSPEHYAIQTAQSQDYELFYQTEISYRKLLFYPPLLNMLVLLMASPNQEELEQTAKEYVQVLEQRRQRNKEKVMILGPVDATISKISDIYRKVVYLKARDYQLLVHWKDELDAYIHNSSKKNNVHIQYDFNPMQGF